MSKYGDCYYITFIKCIFSDTIHAGAHGDGGQAFALIKCTVSDTRHAVWYGDGCQAFAILKIIF